MRRARGVLMENETERNGNRSGEVRWSMVRYDYELGLFGNGHYLDHTNLCWTCCSPYCGRAVEICAFR